MTCTLKKKFENRGPSGAVTSMPVAGNDEHGQQGDVPPQGVPPVAPRGPGAEGTGDDIQEEQRGAPPAAALRGGQRGFRPRRPL